MPVPSRVEELEAALAASFDLEHLAIYADALLSVGDPRGELIQIDLHGNAALDDRRAELERTWLADLPEHTTAITSCGFIDVRVEHETSIQQLFSSTYARQIRRVTFSGWRGVVGTGLQTLSQGDVLPFLTEANFISADRSNQKLSGLGGDGFSRITPNLRTVTTRGVITFAKFQHTAVDDLAIEGAHIVYTPSRWPHVKRMSYAFEPLEEYGGGYSIENIAKLFELFDVPALERLDLTGNTNPNYDVFDFLARVTLPPSVTEIHVPRIVAEHHPSQLLVARQRHTNAQIFPQR
ncbi:MAG: hypothetical protein QM831_37420 [Kofleriaceae bacterium]